MTIHRYSPGKKFVRIYVALAAGQDPMQSDQDAVWDRIKTEHYCIDPGKDHYNWEDAEEQSEERAGWFADWHNPSHWTEMGSIAIDSHY